MSNHPESPIAEVSWDCREATTADLDRIHEISKESLPARIRHPRRMIAGMLAACNCRYLVATIPKTGEVVGFLGITGAYGFCCIYPMAVDAQFRRLGAGAALLTLLKLKCEQYGAEYLSALIQERDVPMQLLLKSAGFICNKTTPDGYSFIWRPEWLAAEVGEEPGPVLLPFPVQHSQPSQQAQQGSQSQASGKGGSFDSGDVVHVEELASFAMSVVESVRRHVKDDATLYNIAADIEHLLGGGRPRETNFTIIVNPNSPNNT